LINIPLHVTIVVALVTKLGDLAVCHLAYMQSKEYGPKEFAVIAPPVTFGAMTTYAFVTAHNCPKVMQD
jgi:hypothetical protein